MVVEVAVQHERQRRGEGVGGAHISQCASARPTEGVPDGLLILHAQKRMHLLTVAARRKATALGEGPRAGDEVRVVALVQFKCIYLF